MLLANIDEDKNNFSDTFKLKTVTTYHIGFVVNVAFFIKIRWSYNSLYHYYKCSMRFVKKILLENLKILPLGDLKI